MTDYYVRTDGNDSNAGTGSGTGAAWLTVSKALGGSGISSGDTVYVAPGTYRETVSVAMTSATSETKVIADVDASEFSDLDGGRVVLTAYTTNDKTNPTAAATITLNSRDFLTFEDFEIVGGNANPSCVAAGSISTDIKFTRCLFITSRTGQNIGCTGAADTALNWTLDSCIFLHGDGVFGCVFTLPTSASADYDAEVQFHNCLLLAVTSTAGILVTSSGADSFKGGGVKAWNCTFLGGQRAFLVNTANISSGAGTQCEVYNSVCIRQNVACLNAVTLGQIVEDYNLLLSTVPRTGVTAGGNSQAGGASGVAPYALLVHLGQELLHGLRPRPFLSPTSESPLLGFGNQSVGITDDFLSLTRPSGPGPTWSNSNNSIGCYERGNIAQGETSTVRTGSNALKLEGPGSHDFEIPVDAVETTVTVYGRFEGTNYTGTNPSMSVTGGSEAGVSDATDTMTGSADAWEQLTLTFTPTSAGVVTIRLRSDDTDGAGEAYFDDFNVV